MVIEALTFTEASQVSNFSTYHTMDQELYQTLEALWNEYNVTLHLLNVVSALAIFIIGRFISGIIIKGVRSVLSKRQLDATLVGFVCNILSALLLALVIITAIGQLGVPTTSFAAIIGASTLAIGFALQGSLGNFAAGVMLIAFKRFSVGDFIDAGGIAGIVEELNIFDTRLRTPDNKVIYVPNGAITSGPITNFSAREERRMDLVVGVSYDDDLRQVKSVLEDILNSDERVLKDPAYTVGVLEMADSSVNFAVRPWVKTAQYWDVFFDLNMAIKLRLDQEGITIPFPQQDVHMHQVAEKAAAS